MLCSRDSSEALPSLSSVYCNSVTTDSTEKISLTCYVQSCQEYATIVVQCNIPSLSSGGKGRVAKRKAFLRKSKLILNRRKGIK